MSIIRGLRVQNSAGWYNFVKTMADAETWAKQNGSDSFSTHACRYVKRDKYSFPVEVDEENIYTTLYRLLGRHSNAMPTETRNYSNITWNEVIELGKCYLVGSECPTADFLRTHTSQTSDWQVLAAEWIVAHPDKELRIETRSGRNGNKKYSWHIFLENDHVVFRLPYHGEGGEKTWVAHVKKLTRKVLIDVD